MKRFLFFVALTVTAQTRQVVITIDDLPRERNAPAENDLPSIRTMTTKLLRPLRRAHAIGFVNAGRAGAMDETGRQSILKQWLDQGCAFEHQPGRACRLHRGHLAC